MSDTDTTGSKIGEPDTTTQNGLFETKTTVAGDKMHVYNAIEKAKRDGVELYYDLDVSMIPGAARNHLLTVARDLEVEFQKELGTENVVREDSIEGVWPSQREKVRLEAYVEVDDESDHAIRVALDIAEGYEARFRREVMKQREKWDDWTPIERVDTEDIEGTIQ